MALFHRGGGLVEGAVDAVLGENGATVHTLNQFLGGFQDLLGLVRERMLAPR